MTSAVGAKRQIDPLTSLRFFAASAVVLYHGTQFHLIGISILNKFQLYQAVSFFYVLSGFVLQHAYRSNANSLCVPKFLVIRFWRLWPTHIASLALFLSLPGYLYWATHRVSFPIWLENISLTQAWIPLSDHYFSLNAPSWSISDEMFFYAVFAFISARAKRAPILVALATLSILLFYMSLTSALHVGVSFDGGLYAVNPIVRLPEFMAGVVLYEGMNRLQYKICSFIVWTILELMSFLVISISSLLIPAMAAWCNVHFSQHWGYYVATAGGCPSFALLIAIFCVSDGALARLFSSRPLVFLGDISFAIYMVHDPVLRLASTRFSGMGQSKEFLSAFIAILIIAAVFHYLIEIPIYSRARRIIEKSSGSPANKSDPNFV